MCLPRSRIQAVIPSSQCSYVIFPYDVILFLFLDNEKNHLLKQAIFQIQYLYPLLTIAVNVSDNKTEVDHVEFYIDNTLKATVLAAPYERLWDEKTPLQFRHQIKIIAYDGVGNTAEQLIRVWKFR